MVIKINILLLPLFMRAVKRFLFSSFDYFKQLSWIFFLSLLYFIRIRFTLNMKCHDNNICLCIYI